MRQQQSDASCFLIVASSIVVLAVFAGKRAVAFFKQPDALQQVVRGLEGLGLCLGLAIVFLALIVAYSAISDRMARKRRLRVIHEGPPFQVRCYPVLLEKWVHGPLPAKLAEEPGQESKWPFDFSLAMTNHGPCILPPAEPPALSKTNPRVSFPLGLFSPNWLQPVFIALGSARLYYMPYQLHGNFKIEMAPPDSFGYSHKTPSVPPGDQLALLLVCQCLLTESSLEHGQPLEHPLLLKMTVLDSNAQYDRNSTFALYGSLYDRIEAIADARDDSWMYQSRPHTL